MVAMILFSCNSKEKKTDIKYPETKKVDQVDTYFGVEVPDPYRWLEDDNSEETAQWVDAQNKVTSQYLSLIPYRDKIKQRLKEVWNYEKVYTPFQNGGYYFFEKNDGLQDQDVLYIQESLDSEPRVILDPNKLSEDGTVALTNVEVSMDGKYLAYGIARGGSDWNEIFVKNIETGEQLDDHIQWVKFSGISWYNDGFFYSRYPKPEEGSELSVSNINKKLYYHKLGTPQSEDEIFYENPEHPERNLYAETTEDQQCLVLYESESTSGNAMYMKDLTKEDSQFVPIAEGFENDYYMVGKMDNKILIYTNDNAPMYRLISVDIENPNLDEARTIIPEKEYVLDDCSLAGGKIIAHYLKDAHSKLEVYAPDGAFVREIGLEGLGTVTSFRGKKDNPVAFYSYTTYTRPRVIYKYDIENDKTEVFFESDIDFDPSKYITEQVFYKSKDGTEVPMFIVRKKDIPLDGSNPTLLYGYGGFNVVYTPTFSVSRMIWLENGGIYVNANIRGGGEYGKKWHEAGTKLQKQNVFDDFIAAAEYLINEKYTSPEKLATYGGSNGGLLIGAVINQRPDLFKVALPMVGVMDMLRYHKFTIGMAWATDYGTSEDNEEMFKYLYEYSPLHNISAEKDYPAVMVFTADHDDRVVPAHSFKYIATLQEKYKGNNPVLIRIETKAGHSAGKPTSKQIEEAADMWSFIFYNLGIEPK